MDKKLIWVVKVINMYFSFSSILCRKREGNEN